MAEVRATAGRELLPVDSEHCAIHQCLAGFDRPRPAAPTCAGCVLTASGGPFRGMGRSTSSPRRDQADALDHPTWSMGAKITIDSSTLMNKGLEVLEASALFGIDVDRVDVVVHPQSIVHSMVEYVDGSVLAQLSRPRHAPPHRLLPRLPDSLRRTAAGALGFTRTLDTDLRAARPQGLPGLALAYEASRLGGAAPAWLSAANEVAVAAFLADEIAVDASIVDVVARVHGRLRRPIRWIPWRTWSPMTRPPAHGRTVFSSQ